MKPIRVPRLGHIIIAEGHTLDEVGEGGAGGI